LALPVSICQHMSAKQVEEVLASISQHMSAYVSMREDCADGDFFWRGALPLAGSRSTLSAL
jgi:hypothetical protein